METTGETAREFDVHARACLSESLKDTLTAWARYIRPYLDKPCITYVIDSFDEMDEIDDHLIHVVVAADKYRIEILDGVLTDHVATASNRINGQMEKAEQLNVELLKSILFKGSEPWMSSGRRNLTT